MSLWCGEPPRYQDHNDSEHDLGVSDRCFLLGDVATFGNDEPSAAGAYAEAAALAVRGGAHWLQVWQRSGSGFGEQMYCLYKLDVAVPAFFFHILLNN